MYISWLPQRQCPVQNSIQRAHVYIYTACVCVCVCSFISFSFHFLPSPVSASFFYCFTFTAATFSTCIFAPLVYLSSCSCCCCAAAFVVVALCFWQGWNTQRSTLHRSRRTKQKFITFVRLALILLGLLLLFSFIHFVFFFSSFMAQTSVWPPPSTAPPLVEH